MVKSGQWQCFQNCHCPLSFVIVFRWLTIDLRLATDLPSLHCISPCLINFQLITILSTLSTVVVHYCPYWHTKYTFQCQCLPWWLCSLPPMQLAVLVCDQWSSALPTAGKCNSRTWHCLYYFSPFHKQYQCLPSTAVPRWQLSVWIRANRLFPQVATTLPFSTWHYKNCAHTHFQLHWNTYADRQTDIAQRTKKTKYHYLQFHFSFNLINNVAQLVLSHTHTAGKVCSTDRESALRLCPLFHRTHAKSTLLNTDWIIQVYRSLNLKSLTSHAVSALLISQLL